MYYIRRI